MLYYSNNIKNKIDKDELTFPKSSYPQVLVKLANVEFVINDYSGQKLQNINWEIKSGENWIVTGFHASGKTSLLKVAAGLKQQMSGRVSILGSPYWNETEENICKIRRKIAFIFEDGNRLLQGLTVAENMALPICYHENKTVKDIKDQVEGILKYLELQEVENLYPSQLNLYQRQCVLLGQAILIKPKLLFVDNPGEGLDIVQKYKMRNMLDDISIGIPSLNLPKVTLVISTQRIQDHLEYYSSDEERMQKHQWMYAVISKQTLHTFQTVESLRMSEETSIKKIIGKWSKISYAYQ